MKALSGFTLIELMYTLAIAALLMGVGIPAFTTTLQNNSMTSSTNSVITALHAARSEAVKRRGRVTLCIATTNDLGNPVCASDGGSLLVFVNTADDASFDAADTLLQFHTWRKGEVTATTNSLAGYVTYTASGFTRAVGGGPIAGDLVFCDGRGDNHARVLSISPTGRPQMRALADAPSAPSCTAT